MNKMDVLKRLADIAGTGRGFSGTLLTADRLDQEDLFEVQSKLARLMADLANETGSAAVKYIEDRFPKSFGRGVPDIEEMGIKWDKPKPR